MSESRKAGSVILANLAMFNESAILFESEIEPAFMEALDKTIEEWASQQEWIGLFEAYADKDTWIYPSEWRTSLAEEESDTVVAGFLLGFAHGEGDAYDLADLCGVGQDEKGFIFRVKHEEFSGKSKWNKFYKQLQTSISSRLQALGFNDCGLGLFFIPIKLDPNLLANAWENEDYVEIMKPVIAVLENIKQSVPIFDELFSLAKSAGLARVE